MRFLHNDSTDVKASAHVQGYRLSTAADINSIGLERWQWLMFQHIDWDSHQGFWSKARPAHTGSKPNKSVWYAQYG